MSASPPQAGENKPTLDCSDIKRGKVGTLLCSNIPCTYLTRKLYLSAAHSLEYKLVCAAHTVIDLHTPVHNIQSRAANAACRVTQKKKRSENIIQINNLKGFKGKVRKWDRKEGDKMRGNILNLHMPLRTVFVSLLTQGQKEIPQKGQFKRG